MASKRIRPISPPGDGEPDDSDGEPDDSGGLLPRGSVGSKLGNVKAKGSIEQTLGKRIRLKEPDADEGSIAEEGSRTRLKANGLEPILEYPGRSFEGEATDFEDLADDFDVTFSGMLSVSFTACWDKLQPWSRIIDFGSGPGRDNIFICSGKSGAFCFHVWDGKKEHSISVGGAIGEGESCEYLCTVASTGLMRVFQDGQLLGQKSGALPRAGKRKFLYVGKSNWQWDPPFCGSISDLKVWNAVVTWKQAFGVAPPPPKPGRKQLLPTNAARTKIVDPEEEQEEEEEERNGSTKKAPAAAPRLTERQKHAEASALELAAKAATSKEFAERLARCVSLGVHFDARFFVKLLVLQTLNMPASAEMVRLTLNMAVPLNGQIVPLQPPVDDQKEGKDGQKGKGKASKGAASKAANSQRTASKSGKVAGCRWCDLGECWTHKSKANAGRAAPEAEEETEKSSAADVFNDKAGKRLIWDNYSNAMVEVKKMSLESLRGSITFVDPLVSEYFSHFAALLHIETLHELKELDRQLQLPPNVLMQRGWMLTGLKFGKILQQSKANKRQGWGLPGMDGLSKKAQIVLKIRKKANIQKLRISSGDCVFLSRTHPGVDMVCDGTVAWITGSDPTSQFENEIVVNVDKHLDASMVAELSEGTLRMDKGFNRIVYERQFLALFRLATTATRHKLWDLLLMTGVGGGNVDAWAEKMLQRIRNTHGQEAVEDLQGDAEKTDKPEDEDSSLPPTLFYEGRDFDGTDFNYEDLSAEFCDVAFGPNCSVMFTACWRSFAWWSRIIDFGNGPGEDTIFIGNVKDTGTLAFHIWAGEHEYRLQVPGAIKLGETNRYLCTVSERGYMRIYKDDILIGEKFGVAPPAACNRYSLYVGKSSFDQDKIFDGVISDLKAWDVVVDCKGVPVPVSALPPPQMEFAGRNFSGEKDDFEDLALSYAGVELSANFSIAFNACWRSLQRWSRIIDFGNGPGDCNIFIGNKGYSRTLAFHIVVGGKEHKVEVNDAIRMGETHNYMCTVTEAGHMRVFQDGQLVAENEKGGAPSSGSRSFLYVGRSHWERDEPFHGWISDMKVWDQVIDGEDHAKSFESQIQDPKEKLAKISAQDAAQSMSAKWRLQEVRENFDKDGAGARLNSSQQRAITAAVGRRLSLVQGPPGTGKTHVSVNLLKIWAKQLNTGTVLAASDSNIAVDNLAEGAQALGLNVVRVGRPEKVTPLTESILLESILRKRREEKENEVVEDDEEEESSDEEESEPKPVLAARGSMAKFLEARGRDLKAEVDEDKGEKKPAKKKPAKEKPIKKEEYYDEWVEKQKVLNEADVICCTTNAAGSNFFKQLRFGAILIDEAAQATELSALVPIVLQGADQLVLVGDHCQLPPSIASFEAEVRGLSLSLFGRLTAQGLNPFFLDTQFRMHPMIAAFSCSEFYHGKLSTGIDASDRPPPSGFNWPIPDTGIAFVHVDGPEESEDGQSKSNPNEAEQVASILADVVIEGELAFADIGVVTPYSNQVKELRQIIRGDKWTRGNSNAPRKEVNSLEIASVDAFQGREKELIIFSAVRSNNSGRVGFLADWRRLNVMITRARRGLIVVGDTRTLRADPTWNRWLSWADKEGLFVVPPEVTEEMVAEMEAELEEMGATDEAAEAGENYWNVVHDAVVRSGCAKTTRKKGELKEGARVLEVELVGERLHFEKVDGEGPAEGWVTISVGDQIILEKEATADDDMEAEEEMEATDETQVEPADEEEMEATDEAQEEVLAEDEMEEDETS